MSKTALTNHTRFVLLDANLVAGYYLPESLSLVSARPHIQNIIDGVRKGGSPEVFLYIPEICIPEVFAVFARYFFATWDNQVRKSLSTKLKKNDYEKILRQFRNDLHYGALLHQVELNRYHILATDLISPVDSYYQHYRTRKNAKRRMRRKMMGAADHTIIGMGINLSRIHGRDNFAILTADHRLADILTRATSVTLNTAEKLGLLKTARKLGLEYGKHIYPRAINLAKTTRKELKGFFGAWPLPLKPIPILNKLSANDCQLLAQLRKKSGVGRDSLPYTKTFETICREFERVKGQVVDRNAAWKAIGRVEKQPKRKPRNGTRRSKNRRFF
jgi:hypothetical protein